jgi:hypothetical protein
MLARSGPCRGIRLLAGAIWNAKGCGDRGHDIFLLTIAAFWLLIVAVPADPRDSGSWLSANSNSVALGLNLLLFAGIAFLWFIGALRDRLGDLEDRFFATVFLGSGLLFLGTLFTAAALVGAVLIAFAARPEDLIDSAHSISPAPPPTAS